MVEKTVVFNIVFHSTSRVLRMNSDQVTANEFLEPIFQPWCHYYLFCLSFLLKNHGLLNHHISFSRHRSPYVLAVNKMPSFCTMEKNAIYFLLKYTVTCYHMTVKLFSEITHVRKIKWPYV